MKIIVKKTLWFTVVTILCLVCLSLFATGGCVKTEYHTVNFTGEGIAINPQSIEHGKHATKPENPERENYGFGGWFTDNGTFANEWDFKTDIVTQDTTLYAKWDTLQNYPIEIPFTEYSLSETSCQWKNFESNKVIIINSDEELIDYIVCVDNDYSKIDFSKYTLLLARGVENYFVRPNSTRLQQVSAQSYVMKVNLQPNLAAVITNWQVPIVVNKLSEGCTIEIIVTLK